MAVLTAHYRTYQALALQDVYKLLYQRVFGPEHSVGNLAAARQRLYLEILQLPQAPSAVPLFEPLSLILCRVNLQSFMQSGSSVEQLWQACRQTVREFQPGTLADLQRNWSVFLATPWARRYAPERLVQFWQSMATAGFPPVHHSRAYAEAYAPHYRVILRTLLAAHRGGR
ncbi:MAG TPA: hypothetical protein VIH59_24675 [Candidatus Tectomicrobia bacterium]